MIPNKALRSALLPAVVLLMLTACNRVPTDALPVLEPPNTDGLLPIVAKQLESLHRDATRAPRDVKATSALGMAYFAYDRYEAAAPALERARLLQPRNWQWQYLLALTARKTGDLDRAAVLLEQLTDLRPDDNIARTRLAQVYVRLGETDKALALFQQVIADDLDNAEARLELARLLMKAGEPAEAKVLLEGLLFRYGPTAVVYAAMAEASRHLGDFEASQRYHNQIAAYHGLSLPSQDPILAKVSRFNLSDKPVVDAAKSLLANGETDKGIRLLEIALQRNPNSIPAFAWLLAAHGSRGEFDIVEDYYQQAREAGPPTVNLLANLGKARARNGRFAAARKAFTEALELDPQDATLHAALGSVAAREGNGDEAEQFFREAIRLDPRNRAARFNLGEKLVRQQQYEEAVEHLQQVATEQDRYSVQALNLLGYAFLQTNQPDLARPHLHRARAMANELGDSQLASKTAKLLEAAQ